MKTLLSLLLTLALVVPIIACGGSDKPSVSTTNSEEKKMVKLRIAFNKNGGQTPQYVADTKGFFKKHGLLVETVEFRKNPDMVAAIESRDIDIMASIPGTVLAAREQGFDLVAFMQNETAKFETPDSGTIIAHKDSGINSLKDLKGKKIAVLTKGSQNTVDALYLIKKAGVDITTLTLIEATFATHFDLLNSKQVDASITVDPFSTQIMTKGIGKLLSYNYIDSNPGQPLGAWWAKRAAIDKNPEVYKAFALAIKDAIDYLHEDEKRARQIVAEYTGLEASLIEKMPIINWNYKIDPSIWQKEFEILIEMGALKQMPKTEDYFHDLIKEYIKK